MKEILSKLRRAVQDYNLIEEGDSIGVGVSGGKDSSTLLYALRLYQRFSPVKYSLHAFTLTLGFDGFDLSPLEKFCKELEIPHIIKETKIGNIIFEHREEKNPCSLCAKMRRGALNNLAASHGCNKVALGHHCDDVIETLFLSMLYEGRISTFSPSTYLDRKDITVIRPMVYIKEKDIISIAKKYSLPVISSPCPINGNTKRDYVKSIISDLTSDIPDLKEKLMGAIKTTGRINLWDNQ